MNAPDNDSFETLIDDMRTDADVSSPDDVLAWATRLEALVASDADVRLPRLGTGSPASRAPAIAIDVVPSPRTSEEDE